MKVIIKEFLPNERENGATGLRDGSEGGKKKLDTQENDFSVEELLRRYSDMVYRLAYARTQNKQDAEDITQEVFLKYIRSNHRFQDEEHRKAWLLRVTVNTTKSLLTSAWHRHYAHIEGIAEESCCVEENDSDVYYAVQRLPEKYRIVIQLYYYEELSVKQISDILAKKESTVKSLLRRGRERIKNIMEEGEQYEF